MLTLAKVEELVDAIGEALGVDTGTSNKFQSAVSAALSVLSEPGTLSPAPSSGAPASPTEPEKAPACSSLRSRLEALQKKVKAELESDEASIRWCSFGGAPHLEGRVQVRRDVLTELDRLLAETRT